MIDTSELPIHHILPPRKIPTCWSEYRFEPLATTELEEQVTCSACLIRLADILADYGPLRLNGKFATQEQVDNSGHVYRVKDGKIFDMGPRR